MPRATILEDDRFPLGAADLWREAVGEAISERSAFRVAFAGGGTPRPLYRALAAEPELAGSWRRVRAFLGDERPVAPSHPESNWRMLAESLLDPVSLPEASRARPRSEEEDLERAARDYEAVLLEGTRGSPSLDLVLLGMGPDGHVASLFPGTDALGVEDRWFVANRVPQLSATRLTLTFPALRDARAVWVLVGGDKGDVLARALGAGDQSLPAARLAGWERVVWIVDREVARVLAANELKVEPLGAMSGRGGRA